MSLDVIWEIELPSRNKLSKFVKPKIYGKRIFDFEF